MDEDVKLKLRLISVVQKTYEEKRKTKTNKKLAAVQQDGCMFTENYL